MKPNFFSRRNFLILPVLTLFIGAATLFAQNSSDVSPSPTNSQIATIHATNTFDAVADRALAAMQTRATELNVKGVAVVSYAEGDVVKSWSSKMLVVGNLRNHGGNLLGIAYSKASEMADTLKASGSGVRPPIKGEYGFQGGVIAKGKTGWLIAAFSGGKSADDVKISQAGLDKLTQSF